MRRVEMQQFLDREEEAGRHVFRLEKLAAAFPGESPGTLNKSLRRMVSAGLLHRAVRGIYFNDQPKKRAFCLAERIALAMRPGHYTYISKTQVLSDWSIISQQTVALTMMTTGRSGHYMVPLYRTTKPLPWNPKQERHGCWLLFSHTRQRKEDIKADVLEGFHLLPYARPEQALSDYRRCWPRPRHELDMEYYRHIIAEQQAFSENTTTAG